MEPFSIVILIILGDGQSNFYNGENMKKPEDSLLILRLKNYLLVISNTEKNWNLILKIDFKMLKRGEGH